MVNDFDADIVQPFPGLHANMGLHLVSFRHRPNKQVGQIAELSFDCLTKYADQDELRKVRVLAAKERVLWWTVSRTVIRIKL